MAAIDVVNRVFRNFRRYTGDGLPSEPVNAPLPMGDPQSGPHSPDKAELRAAFLAPLEDMSGVADQAFAAAEAAEASAIRAETAAAGAEFPVSYAPQPLSPAQKNQARANIGADDISMAFNMLEVADVKGRRVVLPTGGFVDPLASEAGIDTAASVNAIYDGSSNTYSPSVSADPAISQALGANIGDMTSASGLAGAFDGTPTTRAERAAGQLSGYVGKNFGGTPKRIAKATVQGFTTGFDGSSAASNINISLYGKNGAPSNGTDGTLLGTTTPFADPGTAEVKTIASSNKATLFTHVWVYITSTVAEPRIGELVLFEPGPINDMTVVTQAVPASTEVDTVRAGVRVVTVDPAVANTDFTLEVSRGGSWSPIPIELVASMGSEKFYEAPYVDISDDPPGSNMRARFRTLNGKNVSLGGFTLLPRD